MSNRPALKYYAIVHGVAFGFCTVMAFFYATYYYQDQASRGRDIDYQNELVQCLIWWWLLFILLPLVISVTRWAPFEKDRLGRAVTVHLVASAILALVFRCGAVCAYKNWFGVEEMGFWNIGALLIRTSYYWMILGAYLGVNYFMRYRERVVMTSRLEAQLARAQLDVLKMQLQPHFIFNTLHAISTLINHDPESAERMIASLSDLLRSSLDSVGLQEVPLRKELEFLNHYLYIEQIRFGERLAVEREISPDTLGACVPNLILQPVVENAVIHGIGKTARRGWIHLRSVKRGGTLCIEISDNGPGLPVGEAPGGSRVGLVNTKARLEQLYGKEGRIVFITPENDGLTVRLELPFHTRPLEGEERDHGEDQNHYRG